MKYGIIPLVVLLFLTSGRAQLQKPILSASNVDWGWFNLKLNTFSVVPSATQWYIREKDSGNVVLDTKCNQRASAECQAWCKNDFYADERDVREKLIQGCKANTSYIVRARHTNQAGTAWHPWSDSIVVQTPPMSALKGDEIVINVFGDFFVRYGDQCGMNTRIRLGEEESNLEDNFCHATQNEIRRLSGRNIRVVNCGEVNGLQSEFLAKHGGRFLTEFSDTTKYPLAVFCFGANDAKSGLSPAKYAADIDTIVGFLASLRIKSLFNSIHNISDTNFISANLNSQYRNAWSAKMNEIKTSETAKADYLVRGIDFYQLFRLNPNRNLAPDGLHVDLSEGVSNIASKLAPAILDALFPDWSSTSHLPAERISDVWIRQREVIIMHRGLPSGRYLLHLYNAVGHPVYQTELSLHDAAGTTVIDLNKNVRDGMYVVQLFNKSSGRVFVNKGLVTQ